MGKNNTRVRAIDRALQIIESLQEIDGGTVTEVASQTGLPKSTVYNHLQTLHANEYIVKDRGEYRLGLQFLERGGYTREQMDIFQIAKPEIENLAEETGELVNLLVEEHGQGVYLYRERGHQAVNLDSYEGKRQYLHSTAFGKAILAFLPEERVDGILDKHGMPTRTDQTISNRDTLFEELSAIRDQKYAYDDEESLNGLRCIASPILVQGEVVGAVSISGPISRMSGDRYIDKIPELLLNMTNIIEVNMADT